MDNDQPKTAKKLEKTIPEEVSDAGCSSIDQKVCGACGAIARRRTAKFCLVCGKSLTEDYQPLDALRASYKMQGQAFLIENAPRKPVSNLFEKKENTYSQMAWACFVYSLVPYLGILFVPLTIITGIFGYYTYRNRPNLGGRKFSLISLSLSFIVLGAQIILWWLLYIIPELGKRF